MRVSRQFSNVVACSPVLRGTLSARAGFENATVDLFGIDPAFHLQTTNLAQQIVDGSFDDFRNNPNSVIVGSRLAETLNASVGDWRWNSASCPWRGILALYRGRDCTHWRRLD